MESENLDIESIMDARRKAVEQSIRQMSAEELKSIVENLFKDDPGNAWNEPFRQFINENTGSTFYHATAPDRTQVVYCRAKETGIWFIPEGALGILQTRSLETMKEIVDSQAA